MADIYWCKESVAADNVGVVNDFDDPFGLQYALDTCPFGDEIRIVTGANEYGVGSTIWTGSGRNADKSFDNDTVQGNQDTPIFVKGYTDETTEGLVVLDFDTGTGDGFTGGATGDFKFWKNIHVKQATLDGWSHSPAWRAIRV